MLGERHRSREADQVPRVEPIGTLCVGHGMCVELAPEVFHLSYGCVDIPKPNIDGSDTELVTRVRQAVYRCPAKALLISSE